MLAPLRDELAVTGEHDRLGWIRRHVHSEPLSTVVVEGLGDQLARDRVGLRGFQPHGCVIHGSHLDPSVVRA